MVAKFPVVRSRLIYLIHVHVQSFLLHLDIDTSSRYVHSGSCWRLQYWSNNKVIRSGVVQGRRVTNPLLINELHSSAESPSPHNLATPPPPPLSSPPCSLLLVRCYFSLSLSPSHLLFSTLFSPKSCHYSSKPL